VFRANQSPKEVATLATRGVEKNPPYSTEPKSIMVRYEYEEEAHPGGHTKQ
jgi:hypothetical protein